MLLRSLNILALSLLLTACLHSSHYYSQHKNPTPRAHPQRHAQFHPQRQARPLPQRHAQFFPQRQARPQPQHQVTPQPKRHLFPRPALLPHFHRRPAPVKLPPHSVAQTQRLSNYNLVKVVGRMNVELHTGYAKPELRLKGDPRDLAYILIEKIDHKLVLTLPAAYPQHGPVSVDLRLQYLNSFQYRGEGTIRGEHLNSGLLDVDIINIGETRLGGHLVMHRIILGGPSNTVISGISSPDLDIRLLGKARLSLDGKVKLSNVVVNGDGWLSMYWVKSDNLYIRASKKSFLQLAGIANKLDIELWGRSRFNGRYLRVSRLFVKTHDHAVAEVSALDRQHALANDASDIRFYNRATMQTNFMGANGAVLDMREWNRPILTPADY